MMTPRGQFQDLKGKAETTNLSQLCLTQGKECLV